MLNITKGNPIPLRVILSVDDSPFSVANATNVSVTLQAVHGIFVCQWRHGEEDNELYVDGAATLPSGVYGLEVKGKLNGIPWRTFTQCVVKVTYATEQGDNSPVVPSADIYDVKMEVQLYKSASSDEKIAEHNADEAAHPYIQGLLDEKVDKEDGKGLSTNDYTDADKTKLSGLVNYDDTQVLQMIADTNAHFADYYTKAESYSATEVDTLLRTQRQGQYVVAATLPTPSEETMFKIYLVPSQDAEQGNVKDEYITLQDGGTYAWEKIGSTSVDLSGYSTTDEMNAAITSALASYYTKTQADALLSGKQDTLTFDTAPTQGSTNPVTSGGVHTALTGKQDKVQKVSLVFDIDSRQAHETKTLTPNTIAEVTFVDYIDLGTAPPVSGYKTEYCFTFDVDSTVPTLTLPDDIVWAEELELEANSHYVVLISYENGGYYGDWKSYPITVEP